MSARRRRERRRTIPAPSIDGVTPAHWARIGELRTEWLGHALSCAPADRAATEHAVTGLYALLGEPPPEFVWVGSPAAAVPLLWGSTPSSLGGPLPFESRLATSLAWLCERLDHRIGRDLPDRRHVSPVDPVPVTLSGLSFRSVVDHHVREWLRRIALRQVAGLVRAALPESLGVFWYGQFEADWVARYDVHRQAGVARFTAADLAELELWATLARSCGWWLPRRGVCVIAERPLAIRTEPLPGDEDGAVRLHHAEGPAVAYPDGWCVHAWHGTRVPAWVIEEPTATRIAAESNVEVRRCAIERIGWPAFVDEAGLRLVGRASDPANADCPLELYELPSRQWGVATRLLLAVNGSPNATAHVAGTGCVSRRGSTTPSTRRRGHTA